MEKNEAVLKEELKELESQLSCPSGEQGVELGHKMFKSNERMIMDTISVLNLVKHQSILELGHGNAAHVPNLLDKADFLKYVGLEISETMHEQAKLLNSKFTKGEEVEFMLYNGKDLPFEDETFDWVFTVNTIYFWQDPAKMLNEINRVLKAMGSMVICFADKEFMKNLPFVGDKFKLYTVSEIRVLLEKCNIRYSEWMYRTDKAKSKTGELVNRSFFVVKTNKAQSS